MKESKVTEQRMTIFLDNTEFLLQVTQSLRLQKQFTMGRFLVLQLGNGEIPE